MSPFLRIPLGLALAAAGLLVAVLVDDDAGWELAVVAALLVPGVYLLVSPSIPLLQRPPAADRQRPPLVIGPVVRGRWEALNSPTSKVPSHGTHAFAQTYAVDLLAEGDLRRPGPALSRPEDFGSFGTPVCSPVAGTVVRARDGRRDHRNRRGLLGFALFLPESMLRSVAGMDRVLGNHVIVRATDEETGALPAWGRRGAGSPHVLVAHLQRGSVTVRPGDQVGLGDPLGRCGNSGNTTQPHVHVQAMDGPDPRRATGVAFHVDGASGVAELPANGVTGDF
ncbi:peptidoglycan DD-metalloendopeptidase family protein [Modestobacter sp. I12A-02628]|uniref:M23 family metallopeptidase n=1 Tax=Goekera deserti TaxID=2497753 RepID=A0A7K3W9B4_9ACTN|nr:M23 family metallopeptidase [Goekera deserti]MPQ98761.1 peptidoglycan DD-metalloendopeptidase family protein [Goekera deserti]NDI49742.1 peptidoglycan DD-metalloendopeptidase family protein [Goekera deserti]NEL53065.1 M23 family metallopeptidase [Goekera deserti]